VQLGPHKPVVSYVITVQPRVGACRLLRVLASIAISFMRASVALPIKLTERNRAAGAIDSVFSNSLYAFKVDRTRLQELEEAWIPIIGGKEVKAILTYRNCD